MFGRGSGSGVRVAIRSVADLCGKLRKKKRMRRRIVLNKKKTGNYLRKPSNGGSEVADSVSQHSATKVEPKWFDACIVFLG
jgi:hypothetical protein